MTTLMGEKEDPTMPVPLQLPGQAAGWMQQHEKINARVKQGHVDLIFLGDSITQGWEGAGKEVWEKFYGHRNAVNLGISRDRTQHILWRLDHGNVDGISPKLAVVMTGTGNAERSETEQTPAGVKAVVDKLREKLPHTKILLLGIFPAGRITAIASARSTRRSTKAWPNWATTRWCSILTSAATSSPPTGRSVRK